MGYGQPFLAIRALDGHEHVLPFQHGTQVQCDVDDLVVIQRNCYAISRTSYGQPMSLDV